MTARKRILALLLMAICLFGILPLSVSASDVFTFGETYQFTPPGDVSIGYQANGTFLGDIHFEGLEHINDLEVHSIDVSVQVWDYIEPSKRTYDISFGVICSGIYPTGEQQIPLYYDKIFYQVAQDTIYASATPDSYVVQVATLVDDEVVMLDSYVSKIDKILFTPIGIADESIPVNYPYLVSWFTELIVLNNPYLPFADDYIDKMHRFIDVIVSEFSVLLSDDNFLSIVVVISAFTFCGAVLAIFRLFSRRF